MLHGRIVRKVEPDTSNDEDSVLLQEQHPILIIMHRLISREAERPLLCWQSCHLTGQGTLRGISGGESRANQLSAFLPCISS